MIMRHCVYHHGYVNSYVNDQLNCNLDGSGQECGWLG